MQDSCTSMRACDAEAWSTRCVAVFRDEPASYTHAWCVVARRIALQLGPASPRVVETEALPFAL
jgi:hypothetical protein